MFLASGSEYQFFPFESDIKVSLPEDEVCLTASVKTMPFLSEIVFSIFALIQYFRKQSPKIGNEKGRMIVILPFAKSYLEFLYSRTDKAYRVLAQRFFTQATASSKMV